jgi:hypothetical protein
MHLSPGMIARIQLELSNHVYLPEKAPPTVVDKKMLMEQKTLRSESNTEEVW